jgi:7,8-dihydroneopterin aldolase/epimerase/oxygenase
MADQILVECLELSSVIGVPEEERAGAQRLTVSLALEPLRDFRRLGDAIENAVDYAAVAEFVKTLSMARPRRLIETLADEIAVALLHRFPLRAVTLELRKFILPDTAFVAARIHRERPI